MNFFTKVKNFLQGKRYVIDVSFKEYIPFNEYYLSKNDPIFQHLKKLNNCVFVKDVDTNTILYVDKNAFNYKKNDYLLMYNLYDDKVKLTKCIATGWPSMPDLFEGHETPGIGYAILGKLI